MKTKLNKKANRSCFLLREHSEFHQTEALAQTSPQKDQAKVFGYARLELLKYLLLDFVISLFSDQIKSL